MAEHQEAFVGVKGDFVVAVEPTAVVDPSVGAFDHPPSRLNGEPAAGLRAGHDVDGDFGLGSGLGDGGAGVALVHRNVGDGRRDALGPAQQLREGVAVLYVGRGDTAAPRMPLESTSTWRFTPSTFLAPSNPRGPLTGDALTDDESTTLPMVYDVGRRRCGPSDGEVVRQMPPGAARAQHVQDGVEVFAPPLRWARSASIWCLATMRAAILAQAVSEGSES